MENRGLELLELRNIEMLLFSGRKIPPISKELKQRMITNLEKVITIGKTEYMRKYISLKELNLIITQE